MTLESDIDDAVHNALEAHEKVGELNDVQMEEIMETASTKVCDGLQAALRCSCPRRALTLCPRQMNAGQGQVQS